MKLLYAPQSPFARKVRVAAIELGLADRIALEYAEVVPGRKNSAYADTVNPLRKIPALVTEDGDTILDSTVICEYLDSLAGGGRLIPRDGEPRFRALTQHAVAHGMCDAVILIRYETWLRPETLRWTEWIEDQWDKVWTGAAWFEQRLADTAVTPDVAQIALGCCLGYLEFRWPEKQWRNHFPTLARWYAAISARPSFVDTAPRNPAESGAPTPLF